MSNLIFFVLASPVMWFPTYSKGRGKICHQNESNVSIPCKRQLQQAQFEIWHILLLKKIKISYFNKNTFVKVLKMNSLVHFCSIEDYNSGDHLGGLHDSYYNEHHSASGQVYKSLLNRPIGYIPDQLQDRRMKEIQKVRAIK